MFRLSSLTYIVCGIVLVLITWAGFWFFSIDKTNKEIASWQAYDQKLDQVISQPSHKAASERVRKAYETVYAAEMAWKQIADTRTVSAGRINLVPHRWQSTVNVRKWKPMVEQDLNNWVRRGGVRLLSPPAITLPVPTDVANYLVATYFNFPALKFPVVFWPIGKVTVEGTYDHIMSHVRSWSKIPGYVASVRGLGISGGGNRLRGSYDLLVLGFVNTENVFGGDATTGKIPDISTSGNNQGGNR